ncbi:MAG: M48 family metallopeptidase [Ignavibacteria bacterium]|nr:M48 family metallopeptidase [Ignavibacteria bacterium]
MDKSKQYNRIKLTLNIISLVINFVIILILAFSPISKILEEKIYGITSNDYVAFSIFLLIVGVINSIFAVPIDFYSSFVIEHRFKLSNQKFSDWLIEKLKGSIVSLLILYPIALIFYYLLKNYELWWLILAIVVFVFSILLARIAPTLIFPIFYKFTPLENEELKNKLIELCRRFGINFKGIYSFNLSKNTKKANAGFTGIFKSKRIILSDTLIENFTDDEILTVFAHELGHYVNRHILKNILIGAVTTFITFYLANYFYQLLLIQFGFTSQYQISALPLLFLILSIMSILLMPVTNAISRKFEYEADEFAVNSTNDKNSFISSLNKLSKLNLADENPNPIVEFIFYSHPSIKKRIERINKL